MDKMILMVRGHEMWLEASKVKDKDVELGLFYGHNMKVDGSPGPKNITPAVYSPDKNKFALKVKAKTGSQSLKFKAGKAGYYTVVADLSPEMYSNTMKEGFKAGPKNVYKDAIYAGAWHHKDGVAKVPVKAEGPWMFLARHRDPSKGVPDLYDEAVFVTTLALEATRS